jgi:hypothetical protein
MFRIFPQNCNLNNERRHVAKRYARDLSSAASRAC